MSVGALRVRLGGAADAEAVLALERATGPTNSTTETLSMELARSWSRLLLVENTGQATSETADEAPVAYLHYWLVVDEVQVINVATHPAHRRRGHARLLLEELMRDARARGAVSATLEVRASNEPAIELYRAFGFESVGVRKRYYDDGEDAVLMSARLAGG